ncbi:imidazoleglycerol-phosphate dehydratase HisB [Sedimentibacter hydroxybenzoicus DSM 7310]|uniref:Imidazoleglycerol-phosphate dehydratase n=1 Tax=Sedimentibacter hydroxybenzoicus DSM 7310 TaxID=1123245 RepID=A0A974BML6_SEDHY|nr:imidazoleglycerol-phosphate dehydratase HisB [Sedimentibacter hydroxybenzoicus]NYB75641.1 imidazoleglycerol-phosphate dehydratase HisB [Sedimentibacter hydroxybenzoicus DSM 7310]
MRKSTITRKTNETEINVELNIDGSGITEIDTGIGFLNHMLELLGFHAGLDLKIKCAGDLDVDTHHTSEDIGIALGQSFREALGDKKGIERYGFMLLPMDETLARVALDFSGRPHLAYKVDLKRDMIGSMAAEDFKEFFNGFVNNSLCTLHMEVLYGENDHHKIEAVFKGFGRALRTAVRITSDNLQSTKGVL